MCRWKIACIVKVACVLSVLPMLGVETLRADQVTIVIGTPAGANPQESQYWPDGQQRQRPKVIYIGDSVRWDNQGGVAHTATSDLIVNGQRLFDTQQIDNMQQSSYILFDQAKYDAAKAALGITGPEVHIGYHCANHPDQMSGHIVLLPLSLKGKRQDKKD
jgi:hypothetical protein